MTEQQKKELIAGFGFVDFDNDLKNKPPPENWKPMQERKLEKRELTKQEFKVFVQSDWMNYVDKHFNK